METITSGRAVVSPLKPWRASNRLVSLTIAADATFVLKAFGKPWLIGNGAAFHRGGVWYHTAGKLGFESMTLVSVTADAGEDKIGRFRSWQSQWNAGGTAFVCSARVYQDPECVVFAHHFPDGATDVQIAESAAPPGEDANQFVPSRDISTAFPCLQLAPGLRRRARFITYNDVFAMGETYDDIEKVPGNGEGGTPLFIVERTKTLIASPLNHAAVSFQVRSPLLSADIGCGISGEVKEIPARFQHETILYAGNGVTQTAYGWGNVLLTLGGKRRDVQDRDVTLKYLGVYTDNGSRLYDLKEDYEPLLLALKESLAKKGIPWRYLQLDAWWLKLDPVTLAITAWEPNLDRLPHGQMWLKERLQLPFAMYTGSFSEKTTFGDKFDFLPGVHGSVSLDPRFWDHLMAKARQYGAAMFEHDFLNWVGRRVPAVRTDVYAGETWLREMNAAARNNGLSLQLCMSLPWHALESANLSEVTQFRASNDYSPGNYAKSVPAQWRKVGLGGLLYGPLAIAPSKDVFWSTRYQPGSVYPPDWNEPDCELQTLVCVLSRGPVGFGDLAGHSDAELLLRTCRSDGLLLKPDMPATPIDRCFGPRAPRGEIWSTHSTISGITWQYVFAADQESDYWLTPANLHGADANDAFLAFDQKTMRSRRFDRRHRLNMRCRRIAADQVPFRFNLLAPVSADGWAFLGEPNKFIGVSNQRFAAVSPDFKTVDVKSVPGEHVQLAWRCPKKPLTVAQYGAIVDWRYNERTSMLTASFTAGETGRDRLTIAGG